MGFMYIRIFSFYGYYFFSLTFGSVGKILVQYFFFFVPTVIEEPLVKK